MRRLWLLPVHLVTTSVAQPLVAVAPDVFRVWRVWAAGELGLHALTLGIVGEVAWRAYARLPEERGEAQRVLFVALLVPLALIYLTPWNEGELASATWLHVMVYEILPRLTFGVGVICTALVWTMGRQLVPPDPLHASVVMGLGCYLFVYAVSLGHLGQGGPKVLAYVVTPIAYTVLLAVWTWAAWRDEPEPDAPLHVQRALQPWRH